MFSEFKIRSVDELVFLIQAVAWAFVVVILMSVFGGTVGSMLWSVMFNQQPMKTMAPIDMAFTKMLNDVMLLMTGSVTTLIAMFAVNKGAKALAEKIAPMVVAPPPAPIAPTPAPLSAPSPAPTPSAMPDWNFMGYKNPELDEEWRAPPPPTTPADYLDPSREEIANERAAAKLEPT
jgi:hypothetical protein